ncbi:MAG: hypothetical protein ACI8XC_004359 [Gammaproteobacteria bacterium]|jgi:hypothetical protein
MNILGLALRFQSVKETPYASCFTPNSAKHETHSKMPRVVQAYLGNPDRSLNTFLHPDNWPYIQQTLLLITLQLLQDYAHQPCPPDLLKLRVDVRDLGRFGHAPFLCPKMLGTHGYHHLGLFENDFL